MPKIKIIKVYFKSKTFLFQIQRYREGLEPWDGCLGFASHSIPLTAVRTATGKQTDPRKIHSSRAQKKSKSSTRKGMYWSKRQVLNEVDLKQYCGQCRKHWVCCLFLTLNSRQIQCYPMQWGYLCIASVKCLFLSSRFGKRRSTDIQNFHLLLKQFIPDPSRPQGLHQSGMYHFPRPLYQRCSTHQYLHQGLCRTGTTCVHQRGAMMARAGQARWGNEGSVCVSPLTKSYKSTQPFPLRVGGVQPHCKD